MSAPESASPTVTFAAEVDCVMGPRLVPTSPPAPMPVCVPPVTVPATDTLLMETAGGNESRNEVKTPLWLPMPTI